MGHWREDRYQTDRKQPRDGDGGATAAFIALLLVGALFAGFIYGVPFVFHLVFG